MDTDLNITTLRDLMAIIADRIDPEDMLGITEYEVWSAWNDLDLPLYEEMTDQHFLTLCREIFRRRNIHWPWD